MPPNETPEPAPPPQDATQPPAPQPISAPPPAVPREEQLPDPWEQFRRVIYKRFGLPGLTIIAVLILLWSNWSTVKELPGISTFVRWVSQELLPNAHVAQTLSGIVWDEDQKLLAGVEVLLPEFDQQITTDTNGRFSFKIKSSKQRQVRLHARKEGYVTHVDDPLLNNPSFEFTMRRNK
jgi:hypothetical protein